MNLFYHFSEEGTIKEFHPRKPASFPDAPPLVWAIDETHRPLYLFPRDCPRVAFWKGNQTTESDLEKYNVNVRMVITIESGWMDRLKEATIYQYTFKGDSFICFDKNAGYYTSRSTVVPISVQRLESLPQLLVEEDVELRCLPSLRMLREEIPMSSLNFSMIRMRNTID
ncbi:DUF6886 family protein [Pseudalkalibacillus sp. A8]|uniref:DUF6886 family protein n=1 Tax=Pseudalkalibacillus sp. A8 TaxID=3382641 RepID=UPI0038B4CBEA